MQYIIIILLIIILIISVISLFKNINESNITERLGKLENSFTKEIGDFKFDLNKNLNDDFNKLTDRMDNRLNQINNKVNERLDENFEKTNKTFTSVLERLSKIDEAQKKIDSLSNDIISLQGILTDKKTRGIFGEINLKNIMSNVFGEKNNNIYKMQYKFNNDTIADCVLFAPEPLGTVAIDSKFPLENYQIMVDKTITQEERNHAEKKFKQDLKKHIDDIKNKYIIPGITSDQAIMFLPAEAIFAEINAYHNDIIEYAYRKRIWITSPTTLISTLTTIQIIIKFNRYKDRWDKLSRSIETVNKDIKDIHNTTEKITKRFDSINQVNINKIEYNEKSD